MNDRPLRRLFEPLLRRLFHLYVRFSRGLTMGVRALVLDSDGRVFLVKHSYIDGWHLPGGGVEVGETAIESLARELMEEGLIQLTAPPALHGVFFSRWISRRDHVLVYVVREFTQTRMPEPNMEIIASGFFEIDALPADTTIGTRNRIAEVLHGQAIIADWR